MHAHLKHPKGEPIGEELTLALASQFVVSDSAGVMVTNLSTTMTMDALANKFACILHRSKIGEANVTELMQRVGAVIGGEGNGGVIYPRINFCRDSHVGMALILHLLAKTQSSVSDLVADLPQYVMIKEKLNCPSDKIGDVLKMVRREYMNEQMDLRDGVKISFADGWLHVRGSNTEPIIRLISEAGSQKRAREILDQVFEKAARLLK